MREATWQETMKLWVLERLRILVLHQERQQQAHITRISQTRPIRELIRTLTVREPLGIQVESATLPLRERELDMGLQLEQE